MKVQVDADVCGGYGVCVSLCPDVFELGAEGYAVVKVDVVPVEHEAAVRDAFAQCPNRAITVEGLE